MNTTHSFVTTNASVAASTAAFWQAQPGYNVVGFGPTGSLDLVDAASGQPIWASAAAGPWYMVVATKDLVQTIAAAIAPASAG